MTASLRVLATLLAFPALCAALLMQPDSGTLPLTAASGSNVAAYTGSKPLAHTAGAATIPTLNLKLTAGIIFSVQPSVTTAPTNAADSAQEQSSWNSGVISTVVFGCIASILGVLAIWATIWLGRRQTRYALRSNTDATQAREPSPILEDIRIDSITNRDNGPIPADAARVLRNLSPQDTSALRDCTSAFEAPPPAYVSPNTGV